MTTEIDPNILKSLRSYFTEIVYKSDEIIIYEGHIPRVGLILLEGKLEIQMSKTSREVGLYCMLGVNELISNRPFKYAVRIYPNTKVLSLDRSTLLSLDSVKDEEIRNFAKSYLLTA